MISDIVAVVRSLARAKGFVALTVITLALGIGSAAAIFSTVDWMLFRSNNYPPDLRLVGVRYKGGDFMPVCFDQQVRAYREQTNAFSEFQLAKNQAVNVVIDQAPVATAVMEVSFGFLRTLNMVPVLGREFLPAEEVSGHNDVVIISHEFWQKNFAGARDVLGRSLTIGERVCTIVGVLPKNSRQSMFDFSVCRPLVVQPGLSGPYGDYYFAFARLRPGVTDNAAAQAILAAKPDFTPEMAASLVDYKPAITTMAEFQRYFHPEILGTLLGAVGFLYAIACLNAANLMLVRLLGKKHEHSIRLALGASRWRIVRLVAIEGLGVSLFAFVLGILVANWLFPICLVIAGTGSLDGGLWHWWLDGRALAVLGGLTLFTALVIVILPAIRILRSNTAAGLKEDRTAAGESPALRRLRGFFVILQAAFAVILLTGAGLMVRTFTKLQRVSLGFETEHRLKVLLAFPATHSAEKQQRLDFLRRLQERLQQLPGVQSAAYGTDNLLAGYYYPRDTVEAADGSPIKVNIDYAAANYPATVGLKLISGQWLTETSQNEIVVSESFAKARYPNQNPIGQLLRPPTAPKDTPGWTVVGVFGDVHDTVRGAPGYRIYAPENWYPPVMNCCILRFNQEVSPNVVSTVQRTIYEFDPKIVCLMSPLSSGFSDQIQFERFTLSVLKVLSLIALALTIAGIFSVLAYTVDLRRREFGLRFAIGATTAAIMKLVLSRGLLLTTIGISLGLVGAFVLTRFLQSILFETRPYDPVVLILAASVLLVAAASACIWPAWRATKVDVARLLQAE
ncbi:MAG: ABC transporter permease [Nibricoccus sp.]